MNKKYDQDRAAAGKSDRGRAAAAAGESDRGRAAAAAAGESNRGRAAAARKRSPTGARTAAVLHKGVPTAAGWKMGPVQRSDLLSTKYGWA